MTALSRPNGLYGPRRPDPTARAPEGPPGPLGGSPGRLGLIPGLPVPPGAAPGLLLGQYRTAQAAVAVRAALAIVQLWNRYVVPARFMDSWNQLGPLINGIIATHYSASAASAAQFYGHSRVVAGYPAYPVPGASLDQEYLNRVTGSMGPGQFFHFIKEEDPETASGMAQDALRGAGTRMVLKGGRDTIVQAAGEDKVALGWERVITPGSCGFCAMLAGRGGVYTEKSVDFRAHDHCHCVARPVFTGQKSVNEGLSAEWAEATKGTRGAAARAAWDKYWSSHGPGAATEIAQGRESNGPVPGERVGQPALPNSG